MSILNYLGRLYGFVPESPYEIWRVESAQAAVQDTAAELSKSKWEKDEAKQKELFGAFLSKTFP